MMLESGGVEMRQLGQRVAAQNERVNLSLSYYPPIIKL
jgi:hypothetical protein